MSTRAKRLAPKLLRAINARDVAATRAALDEGAGPNTPGGYNALPLTTAASIHDDEAARNAITALLLERGADPNDRGPYRHDNRPVFYAAYCGYDEVVRMLLDKGGFPRDERGAPARNGDGSTLLALACTSGMRWLVERALAEGCRADDVDDHGSTALHYATVVRDVPDRPGKDTAWFVHTMLDHGAPIEHVRPGDWGTALHWAVSQGDAAAVQALVSRGANLEARTDRTGQTPFVHGAAYGTAATLRAAHELGADAHARDAEGRTALHVAAARSSHANRVDLDVLRLLLDLGLDPNATTSAGKTALEVAVDALPRKRKRVAGAEPAQLAHVALLAERTDPAVVARVRMPK